MLPGIGCVSAHCRLHAWIGMPRNSPAAEQLASSSHQTLDLENAMRCDAVPYVFMLRYDYEYEARIENKFWMKFSLPQPVYHTRTVCSVVDVHCNFCPFKKWMSVFRVVSQPPVDAHYSQLCCVAKLKIKKYYRNEQKKNQRKNRRKFPCDTTDTSASTRSVSDLYRRWSCMWSILMTNNFCLSSLFYLIFDFAKKNN